MLKLCTHYFISVLSVSHQSITWTTNVEDSGRTGQAQNSGCGEIDCEKHLEVENGHQKLQEE